MGNKQLEIECLKRVLINSKSLRGESKRIVQYLTGTDVERDNDERPDFVKRFIDNSVSTIVGVEHFLVDYSSITKSDGKIAGTTTKFNNDLKALFSKYSPLVNSGDISVLDGAHKEITQMIADHLLYSGRTSYSAFLKYFRNSLEKHVKSIEVYRNTISSLSKQNEKQKLIFLIEVHSDFHHIFYNNGGNCVKLDPTGTMPLFKDVVEMLKMIDSNLVDHIILCCSGPLYNDQAKVYAFSTKNMESSIKKCGTRVYEYFGEDMLLNENVSLSTNDSMDFEIDKVDGNYVTTYIYNGTQLTNEAIAKFAKFATYQAYLASRNKKDFVATRIVQGMLNIFRKNIRGWIPSSNQDEWWDITPFAPGLTDEIAKQRNSEFNNKWFPKREK